LAFHVEYKSSVLRDLNHLDHHLAERIIRDIEDSIGSYPDRGEPIAGEFKGFFKYRIGEYRVIYARYPDSILILRIGHRRSVYR